MGPYQRTRAVRYSGFFRGPWTVGPTVGDFLDPWKWWIFTLQGGSFFTDQNFLRKRNARKNGTHEAMIQNSKLQGATGSEAEPRSLETGGYRNPQPSKVCVFELNP